VLKERPEIVLRHQYKLSIQTKYHYFLTTVCAVKRFLIFHGLYGRWTHTPALTERFTMKRGLLITILLGVFFIATCNAQSLTQQKAPNFVLKSLDGKNIELAKLKGKVVVVNFWATWCPPCRAEIPDFIKVYDAKKSKGLVIVGIALDEEGWSKVKPFVEKNKINYPVVLGTMEVVQQYGGIDGIPTTFIVDKKGNIVDTQVGMMSKSMLEQKIAKLLD